MCWPTVRGRKVHSAEVCVTARTASSARARERCGERDTVGEERLTSWKVKFLRIAALVAGSGAAGCSLSRWLLMLQSAPICLLGGFRRDSDVGICERTCVREKDYKCSYYYYKKNYKKRMYQCYILFFFCHSEIIFYQWLSTKRAMGRQMEALPLKLKSNIHRHQS